MRDLVNFVNYHSSQIRLFTDEKTIHHVRYRKIEERGCFFCKCEEKEIMTGEPYKICYSNYEGNSIPQFRILINHHFGIEIDLNNKYATETKEMLESLFDILVNMFHANQLELSPVWWNSRMFGYFGRVCRYVVKFLMKGEPIYDSCYCHECNESRTCC